MIQIEIPSAATGASILLRNASASRVGEHTQLDQVGHEHISSTIETWQHIIVELARHFNPARLFSSTLDSSILTMEAMFPGQEIQSDGRLWPRASLIQTQGPNWIRQQREAGKSFPAIIRTFLHELREPAKTGFMEDGMRHQSFVLSGASGLQIACAHEPALSLIGQSYVPDEQLGFLDCQGIVFFVAHGRIQAAQKIAPIEYTAS